MHELALTEAIVAAITERTGAARIECVRLEIGALSGVLVDSIRFCFEAVAEGTPVAGARLKIDRPLGEVRCRTCGNDFTTNDSIIFCPACDGIDVEVLSGHQLRIRSVEVSTECATPVAAVSQREPE
jgi:hydrogenase nickel incorporation protein HypA/HybF